MTDKTDGAYGEFTGTVTDVGFTKHGGMFARMQMMKKRVDGSEYPQKFTAWDLADTSVSKGARITVAGKLTIKPDSWTDKEGVMRPSVDISLNDAKVISRETEPAVQAVEEIPYSNVPPVDEWQTAAIGGQDTPF